jgi:hypothetical protein
MIDQQYNTIMDIHGDWLDSAIDGAARQSNTGSSMDTREFTRRIDRSHAPDGIQALTNHHFHELVERRLEYLTSVNRTQEQKPSQGWRTFKVLDILDALASL